MPPIEPYQVTKSQKDIYQKSHDQAQLFVAVLRLEEPVLDCR